MQSPIPAPPVASLADFIRGHQRAPGRTSSRVTAGVLTAMLYVSLVLLARLLSAPDFQPPTEIFATVVTDGPVKKIVRAPPPFLAHLIRPHAESIAPPAFTVAPDVPAAPTTLMASGVQSSPVTAGVSAGTGADGQGISGKGMTASGSNGNGDDLAGCWDKSWAQAVADRVRQFSYYPPAARRDHKTGVVMVHLSVRRYGRLALVKIEKSSGHLVLDRAALGIVRRAEPLPQIPDRMHADRVDGVLPLEFGSAGGAFHPSAGTCVR